MSDAIKVGDKVSTLLNFNDPLRSPKVTGRVEKISPRYLLLHIRLDEEVKDYPGYPSFRKLIRHPDDVEIVQRWGT